MKKVIATILSCALLASLTGATDVEETQIEETTETSYEEVVESSQVEETIELTESSIEESTILTEVTAEETTAETEVTIEETTVTETEVIEETTVETTVEETQAEIEDMYNFDNASYFTNDCNMYLTCDYSVRVSADPNAEVIATLPFNTMVHEIEMAWDSPWVKVEINGMIGYVNMYNLSNASSLQEYEVTDEEAEQWFGMA